MRYPLPELLDRMSIVMLKIEKLPEESENLIKELSAYKKAIKGFNLSYRKLNEWLSGLYKINKKIWSLEAKIRRGDIEGIPLEKIGETALKIRKINGQRIKLKGDIAEKTRSGFRDIKINHASEETSR